MNQYTVGQSVQLKGTFKDVSGNPFDPAQVKLWVRLPDGTVSDLSSSITKVSIGIYTNIFTPALNGLYEYHWEGDGVTDAANECSFTAQTFFPDGAA